MKIHIEAEKDAGDIDEHTLEQLTHVNILHSSEEEEIFLSHSILYKYIFCIYEYMYISYNK